jgi:hypothetical protein
MKTVATAVTLLFVALAAHAQAPAEVRAANERIAARDLDGAITILEDFTAKQPARGAAVLLLARTYAQKGDSERALSTYERAALLPAVRGQAWFGIATVHAHAGRTDRAFEFLQRVRDTGSFDFDLFSSDAGLEPLRKDPRFAALVPKASDFVAQFAEKPRVLHEMRGDAKGAQFGWIARRVGDVDGDKASDFVTSAPTYSVDGGQPAGRVVAYSSRTGKLLWQKTGKAGEQLGLGVEGAGDTNRDGIPDVVASAPGSSRAYVFSGRDGAELLSVEGKPGTFFGAMASTAGDINGDGSADIIIGAPRDANGAGRALVYSGKDGSLLLSLDGEKAGDGFGSAVAGTIRGKGPILLVSAPAAGPRGTGRVYMYRGASTKPAFTFESDETGGSLGSMFLSVVGDTNGDKTPDVYISDWANSAKGRSTGRVYVYSGNDGKLLFTLTGEAANDGFGIGVADAGDVDRDGADDLIVGAWQHGSGATSAGKVYVYSGRTQKLLRTITSKTAGDTFGFDTTNLGDVNGDGTIDFLITAAWSGVSGFQSGRVFVISGKR